MATAIGSYVTTSILKTRAGITDTTDDNLLGVVCDQVNQWVEGTTGRVLAPVASVARTFDGTGTRCLRIWQGVRSISLLEVAPYTGAAFTTVTSTDYFTRPETDKLAPAEPYSEVWLSDRATSGYGVFPVGYGTVRITATWGPAAIPDDVAEAAAVIAVRTWFARQAGNQDVAGTDEMGRPLVTLIIPAAIREILRRYTVADMLA